MDIAKYDAAVDRHLFLKRESQEVAFTPAISNDGNTLPYGLGWFVQHHQGLKLIWHYGYWPQFSALILKVPQKSLTMIVLSNSDGLSAPFRGLGGGSVLSSPLTCIFLRLFVIEESLGKTLPDPQWSLNSDEFTGEMSRSAKQVSGYNYDCEASAHSALSRWLKDKKETARTSIKLDPKVYEAYVGRYQLTPQRVATVKREGDRLFMQVNDNYPEELFPESPAKFFVKRDNSQIEFVKNETGQVTHLVYSGRESGRANRIK
jgi:hypothetical protein